MALIANHYRLSNWLKANMPQSLSAAVVTVNDSAQTSCYWRSAGKVTATGKYKGCG